MAKDQSIAVQRTPELPGLVKRGRPVSGKAKTNAERQAEYRKRARCGSDGLSEHRLNTMLAGRAFFALDRLAAHYGVTKKQMLERLLVAADDDICVSLNSSDAAIQQHYLDAHKVDCYFPERPNQAHLDAVLAAEAVQEVAGE